MIIRRCAGYKNDVQVVTIGQASVNTCYKKYYLLFFLCSFFVSSASAQSKSKEAHAQSLYKHYKNKKALRIYNRILSNEPDNMRALWHSSLLYCRIGENFKRENKKKTYYKRAEKRAKGALAIDRHNSEANFAMAVATGQMARVGDIQAKLDAAGEVKKYAERAVKADPQNAGAWFVLGGWNYKIATMSSVKETMAQLFTHVPSGASLNNAEKYMKKAVSLHPSYILYYLWLARTYKAQNNNDLAVKTCRGALDKPNKHPKDAKYKRECRKLISELSKKS